MKNILKFLKLKYVYIICAIHFLISCILSYNFFHPIKDNAGSENIAYKFYGTGLTLEDDFISRVLCWLYAHILAIIFIVLFWNWIAFLIKSWKNRIAERKYIVILLLFVFLGILTIVTQYPTMITTPPDTTYNYVYAKEWLPMYWHGFLTNVIHCACLLVFTHPVSLSVIPFLFGINIIFYFTYYTIIKYSGEPKIIKALIWGIVLLLMPETIQLLTYAGRNYMYAILSVCVLGIFMKDYLEGAEFSVNKFLVLSVLIVCLATWRSEGIIYLFFYPALLYFTYFFERHTKDMHIDKKRILKGIGYVFVVYLILSLPGKYGNDKYQGYDYFIINTPGPLAAVLADENANLGYDGVEKDLETINDVIPIDYIKKFGRPAVEYYNFDNMRLSRQSDAGNKGKDYVVASYRILFHNWKIYFKYQVNLYFQSIGVPWNFNLTSNTELEERMISEEVQRWEDWLMDYYYSGSDDISEKHDIVLIDKRTDSILSNIASRAVSKLNNFGWKYAGFIKIAVSLLVIISSLYFLVKKQWIYVCWGIILMGLLAIIILMAPAARYNYYYSVYFNQYWLLLFMGFQIKRDKLRCHSGGDIKYG